MNYLNTLDVTRKVLEKLEVVFIFLALIYQRKNKPHVSYSMGECLKILSIGMMVETQEKYAKV